MRIFEKRTFVTILACISAIGLANCKTRFLLSNEGAEMELSITEDGVLINSLETSRGTSLIPSPCPLKLPDLGLDLRFESAESWSGSRNASGYKFTYACNGVRLDIYAVTHPSFKGPFEFYGYVTNGSEDAVRVLSGSYFDLDVRFPSVPSATTFHKEGGSAEGWTIYSGSHFDGTGMYTTKLSDGATATAAYTTHQDWNAGGDISMMYVETGKEGMYFAQEWSNGKLTARGGKKFRVSLSAELGTNGFTTLIPAGGSFYLPSIYVGAYDGDMDDGSNAYKRWFIHCKAPENMIQNPEEPLVQQDLQIGYDVSQYGIQAVKMDYGWWAPNDSELNEGSVYMKSSTYRQAIGCSEEDITGWKALSEYTEKAARTAREKGLYPVTLTTYILLKDTRISDDPNVPTSIGPYGHPEWFSDRVIRFKPQSTPSADLGNPECVAFYQKYLSNFIKSTGITTWRSDFEPICFSSDKENRHAANGNDVQYWCTYGFAELVDYLRANIEGFRYESCSSGGSMKDLFTMTRASVINCDDTADYMSLHMSFYSSSYCIHPAQLQLPVNSLTYTPGSTYHTGCADYMYGLRCQITGAIMLTNWQGTGNGQPLEPSSWKTVIAGDYNQKLKPLIREGDLYHILPRPDGKNWDGLEYVDTKGEKAAVMVWKPTEADHTKTVRLRGLSKDLMYKVEFTDHPYLNCEMNGRDLMDNGLVLDFPEEVASDIIYISQKESAIDETVIDTAEPTTTAAQGIYDFAGRCVVAPANGLYIISGQKVLIK